MKLYTMKKIFTLIASAILLFSCSSDDSQVVENTAATSTGIPDFQKLEKVIFMPGGSNETVWHFNSDGVLSEIKNRNGVVIQSFTYDSNQNLTLSVKGNVMYTFGYDNNNHMTNFNGQPLTYNVAQNSYTITFASTATDDYLASMTINLSADSIILNEDPHYISSEGGGYTGPLFGTNYSNGNMTQYYVTGSNGESDYRYDTHTNPFKKALLPICRAFSVACFLMPDERFATGEYNSENNVIFNGYDLEGPEDLEYVYEYNEHNLPVKRTSNAYYLGALEHTYVSAEFEYQPVILPKK